MKRPTRDSNAAGLAPLHIDTEDLCDHASEARIDRIWNRVEQNLELSPQPAKRQTSRWWLAAAGVAAGFALGAFASHRLNEAPTKAEQIALAEPIVTNAGPQVFAAGGASRMYSLPGGGQVQLEPDSILDTVEQQGLRLVLRLRRGQATLVNPNQLLQNNNQRQLKLLIGNAEINAIRGQLRVKLDGMRAQLTLLDGSANVSSPQLNQGQHFALKRNVRTIVATAALTAAVVPPQEPPPVDADPREAPVAMVEVPEMIDSAPLPVVMSSWAKACNQSEYVTAVKLLGQGAAAAAQVSNPAHLTCIATGHQALKDGATAMVLYQRVVNEFADSPYALTAAHYLARIHRAAGNAAEQQRYEQLAQQLSKGALLSEQALCKKIQNEAAANSDAVVSLGKRYIEQYPGGPCSNTVERLLGEVEKRKQAEADAAQESGDSPYPDEQGAAKDSASAQKPAGDAGASKEAPNKAGRDEAAGKPTDRSNPGADADRHGESKKKPDDGDAKPKKAAATPTPKSPHGDASKP